MSPSLSRPPRDITPKEFFESWLPGEYDRLRAKNADLPEPPDVTINITIDGDGGGVFGPWQGINTAADGNSVYACDLDGDGDNDILSAHGYYDLIAWN